MFISYAHASMRAHAMRLHRVLAGRGLDAFLDTARVSVGDPVAEGIVEGVLAAHVIVVFLDPTYMTRWYCIRELLVAAEAARMLILQGAGETDTELAAAQQAFVIVLGEDVGRPELDHLPPFVAKRIWPHATEIRKVVALIASTLAKAEESIGERLERLGALNAVRRRILHELELPPPADLRRVPVYHETGFPDSIRDAFVGREALMWELHTTLRTQGAWLGVAASTGVLQGGAGSGKTRVALEYVHRYGPVHYPGGLLWVNADVPEDHLEAQFHGMLRALDPGSPDLMTFRRGGVRVEDELRRVLTERRSNGDILYVVDNVPEPRPGERPLPIRKWCPVRGLVTLLITSRASPATGEAAVWDVPVGVLAPTAAVDLLTYRYSDHTRLDETAWLRIADWVGRLPLALTILNASLRRGAISASELAEMAGRPDVGSLRVVDHHVEALRAQVPAGELAGVAAAFQASYRRLPPRAQRSARLLAQLAPDAIPVALLRAFGDAAFPPEVRAVLVARSFITPVAGTSVETFGTMHSLLAEFLVGIGDGYDEMRSACEAVVAVISWEACKDPRTWSLLDATSSHAAHLFDRGSDQPGAHIEPLLNLGANLGYLLRLQGRYKESAVVRNRVLELAIAALGDWHPRTLRAMGELAGSLRRLGDLERSRELAERVLEVSLAVLGPEHPGTLHSMGTLAATLRDQGELERSKGLAEQVLAARVRKLGAEHVETLVAMGNLAATLRRLGKLPAARDLEERLLALRRQLHGDDHPETLTAMAHLGTTLRLQGELERARRLQEHVLNARHRLLGPEHLDTLRAIDHLATTLQECEGEPRSNRQSQAGTGDQS